MKPTSLMGLLRKVHQSEDGAVSIETVLVIGMIALPILGWLVWKKWPQIKAYFDQGLGDLEQGGQQVGN
jgi:hypothetical protein